MKKYHWIILVLVLSGCSPISSVVTPSITSTPFLPPTATSTPIWTANPISIVSPTKTPYLPISTPLAKESSEITLELLQTNNGCDLPCWWGINPNQTNWSNASEFLKPFSTIYERQPPSDWFVYDVRSPISTEVSELGIVEVVFAARDGIVREIEANGFNEYSYSPSSILMKYGIPSQVLISSYSSDYGLPPNQVPLSIDLYYPQKGINVLYGTYATVKGEQITGCLKSPHLFLWSPSEHTRTINYILGWDSANTPYMSIEEATDLDIQDFYEKYSNPENSLCLQTPTNLWPSQ
ncbi:MAG: hypothetical protein HZB18_05015 [Chloroflexi bacterium]|nr:hypothetical protein [Chloroflexota bacterium]